MAPMDTVKEAVTKALTNSASYTILFALIDIYKPFKDKESVKVFWGIIAPVSYTHLDVYKRQVGILSLLPFRQTAQVIVQGVERLAEVAVDDVVQGLLREMQSRLCLYLSDNQCFNLCLKCPFVLLSDIFTYAFHFVCRRH